MKKLIIAIVVGMLASGAAYAKTQEVEACEALADFAFASAQMRDEGYTRREARVIVSGAGHGAPADHVRLLLNLVEYAYREGKDAESTANDILVWCWNEFGVFKQ